MPTKTVDLGRVVGPQGPQGLPGPKGDAGPAGASPYQVAVAAGYTGTEAAFYAALVALQNGPFLPLGGGTLTGDLKVKGGRVGFSNQNSDLDSYIDGDNEDGDLELLANNYLTLTAGEEINLKAGSVCLMNGEMYDAKTRGPATNCFRNIRAGTAAVSSLTTGAIYLQYE